MSPFDPRTLHATTRVTRHTDVVLAPDATGVTSSAVMVPEDPGRVWLLVQTYLRGQAVSIVAKGQGGAGAIIIPDGQSYIIIHAATLPGMLAGGWYVFGPATMGYGVFSGSNYFGKGGV